MGTPASKNSATAAAAIAVAHLSRIMFSIILIASALVEGCLANGRAFPLDSENYAIKLFQSINPNIEYDETNFLVDLSGQYTTCDRKGEYGQFAITETTADGSPITGLVDSDYGPLTHANAVNDYIQKLLDSWVNDPEYTGAIRGSTKVGCSVRPGCDSYFVVTCALSGMGGGNLVNPTTPGQGLQPADQHTQAFTNEQYDVAEGVTGISWDRSHFLENLSGYQTQCAIVKQPNWSWGLAQGIAAKYDMHVSGMAGHAVNEGETEPAMMKIIKQFKPEITKVAPEHIGCSLIPDCIFDGVMYVVVGCVYQV